MYSISTPIAQPLLTFALGATAVGSATYGQGTATTLILLDDVGCIGSETRVIDCSNRGLGIHNCAHSEDAGVICQSGTQGIHILYSMLYQ